MDLPQDRLLNESMDVERHLLVREENISLHSDKYGTSEMFNSLIISTSPPSLPQ